MNNLAKVFSIIGISAGSFGLGIGVEKYLSLKHTPQETIDRLNRATEEFKASKKASKEAEKDNLAALNAIKATKKAYQDEIRPEIEAKVRRELQDYIASADSKYERAKEQNEMAKLRLELAKNHNGR